MWDVFDRGSRRDFIRIISAIEWTLCSLRENIAFLFLFLASWIIAGLRLTFNWLLAQSFETIGDLKFLKLLIIFFFVNCVVAVAIKKSAHYSHKTASQGTRIFRNCRQLILVMGSRQIDLLKVNIMALTARHCEIVCRALSSGISREFPPLF